MESPQDTFLEPAALLLSGHHAQAPFRPVARTLTRATALAAIVSRRVNKRQRRKQRMPTKALSKAFRELAEADPIKYVHIMGALFPDMIRETAKDHLAEIGMTEDDLRELIQKLEACPQ